MKTFIRTLYFLLIFVTISSVQALGSVPQDVASNDSTQVKESDKLVVVWTSGDREVALKMVFMYTYNAKKYGWWNDITLLVWGPSSKLLSEDEELQKYVEEMKNLGVNLLACKGCADQYGVSEKLSELGVTVKYTGTDLTNFIKERKVITF